MLFGDKLYIVPIYIIFANGYRLMQRQGLFRVSTDGHLYSNRGVFAPLSFLENLQSTCISFPNKMMTRFIFSVKVACILCCAALWSINSYSQTPYKKIDLGYGKWSKSWFADDFGDPMYDKPYIQSELRYKHDNYSYSWFYIRFTVLKDTPVFEVILSSSSTGNYTLYGTDATIKFKSANGNVSTITAPISEDQTCIILLGDNAVRFAALINSGNYSVAVSAHTAWSGNNDVSRWTFSCTNETKDFIKAAKAVFNH